MKSLAFSLFRLSTLLLNVKRVQYIACTDKNVGIPYFTTLFFKEPCKKQYVGWLVHINALCVCVCFEELNLEIYGCGSYYQQESSF